MYTWLSDIAEHISSALFVILQRLDYPLTNHLIHAEGSGDFDRIANQLWKMRRFEYEFYELAKEQYSV